MPAEYVGANFRSEKCRSAGEYSLYSEKSPNFHANPGPCRINRRRLSIRKSRRDEDATKTDFSRLPTRRIFFVTTPNPCYLWKQIILTKTPLARWSNLVLFQPFSGYQSEPSPIIEPNKGGLEGWAFLTFSNVKNQSPELLGSDFSK